MTSFLPGRRALLLASTTLLALTSPAFAADVAAVASAAASDDQSITRQAAEEAELRRNDKAGSVETVIVIIEALLIAMVFRTFLYQPFSIPTGSMQSTLMIGDYFIANKFIWGLGKYSFPVPLPLGDRILTSTQPQQGDVAVFFNGPTGQDYV